MKNILRIFRDDVSRLVHNPVALIVTIGLIVIPSIYAWVNIYANWDPYSNTGELTIAVTNQDQGGELLGFSMNIGEEIQKNLGLNDDFHWVFTTEEEAVDGLYAGEYYAALVIPESFTGNLLSLVSDDIQPAEIYYLSNQKKNAIASKITDTGMGTLESTINQAFVETITRILQEMMKSLDSAGLNDLRKQAKQSIENASLSLDGTILTLESLDSLLEATDNTLTSTDHLLSGTASLLTDTQSVSLDTAALTELIQDSLNQVGNSADVLLDGIYALSDALEDVLLAGEETGEISKEIALSLNDQILQATEHCATILERIQSFCQAAGLPTHILDRCLEKLQTLQDLAESIDRLLTQNALSPEDIQALQEKAMDLLTTAQALSQEMGADLDAILTDTATLLGQKIAGNQGLLTQTAGTLQDLSNTLLGAKDTLSHGHDALRSITELLLLSQTQLGNMIQTMDTVSNSDYILLLEQMISNDAEEIAAYIASPVQVVQKNIYPIENYGSAMSPFYTTLSLWVGGLILLALIHPGLKNPAPYPNLQGYQVYFGRFLLFACLSICQALICCGGDILILGCQCLHPAHFLLAGVVSSLIYTLFIYTLTAAFSDVGKAIAVVFMVFQVAGAGGTFPIEVMPGILQVMNPVMPFTFTIDAMREAVAGLYQNLYWLNLLKLFLIYVPLSLLIGLVIRRQVSSLTHWFEQKLQDTDLF